jgi:hypothetical protein
MEAGADPSVAGSVAGIGVQAVIAATAAAAKMRVVL